MSSMDIFFKFLITASRGEDSFVHFLHYVVIKKALVKY